MKAALLLALMQAPPVAAPAFHPIEGVVYRCDTRETRTEGPVKQYFHASRQITFRREGDGYVAELTLDQADQAGAGLGPAFMAGNAALMHIPIRIHVDATGSVTTVEDADALIERLAAGIEAAARKQVGAARAAAMVAPLRAFDSGQRRVMLGSTLSELIRPGDLARADGTSTVTLPPRPPLPPGAGLPATETVSHADGMVSIATHGAGPIAVGGPTVPGAATGSIAIDTLRRVDPATGLVVESRTARTITATGATQTTHAETIVTLRAER